LKFPDQFGFYAILTDPLLGYEYTTELLKDHGIVFVQLRIKDAPDSQIESIAEKLNKITDGSNTRLIINDNPHIAKRIGADGVHVGQNDMAFEDVRSIIGEEAIAGLSTHSPEQTRKSCLLKPDYIGIGPVFPTPTKKNPDPVIGIDGMKEMLGLSTVPSVAIGGIDFSNLRMVLEAGAKNFCMVRQFTKSQNPASVLKEIDKIYKEYYPNFK